MTAEESFRAAERVGKIRPHLVSATVHQDGCSLLIVHTLSDGSCFFKKISDYGSTEVEWIDVGRCPALREQCSACKGSGMGEGGTFQNPVSCGSCGGTGTR